MRIYLIFIFFNITLTFPLYSQTKGLKTLVVVIKSLDNDLEEIGTGIIVGYHNNSLFVLTTAHALVNPQKILVRFHRTLEDQNATVVVSSSRWDIAVIKCNKPENYEIPQSYHIADGMPVFKEEVMVNWSMIKSSGLT